MLRPPQWCWAPERPTASPDHVHVWRIDLDSNLQPIDTVEAVLSEDERARAARFVYPRHHRRFAICRAALRSILGRYLSTRPIDVRFATGPHGKPALAAAGSSSGIRFSVSHSDRLALVAITHSREVGIDVERIRPDVQMLDIARRYFGHADAQTMASLGPEDLPAAFFRCWCSHEACVKALGVGLAGLQDVRDNVTPPEGWLAAPRASGWAGGFGRWAVSDLDIDAGFAASLAVEGRGCCLAGFSYQSIDMPELA